MITRLPRLGARYLGWVRNLLQLDRIHVFTFKMLISLLPNASWRTETDRVGGGPAVRPQLPTLGSGGLAIFMGHCYERGYSPVTLFVEWLIAALSLAFRVVASPTAIDPSSC